MRRALDIFVARRGAHHPNSQGAVGNQGCRSYAMCGCSTMTEIAAIREAIQSLLNICANCRWLKRALDLVVTQNA